MLAVIEWGKIGEVIWVSLVMGVGVVGLFSLAIYGGSRAAESRRTGDGPSALYATIAGCRCWRSRRSWCSRSP